MEYQSVVNVTDMSEDELLKLTLDFRELSNEDDWDPFKTSESDYVRSSNSDWFEDSEIVENIGNFIMRKKVKLYPKSYQMYNQTSILKRN